MEANGTFSVLQPLPIIYIASGLFSTNVTINATETASSISRATAVMAALQYAGLTSIITKSTPAVSDIFTHTKLYAEQHAYTDLLLLQQSSCFIPAFPFVSSLTYVVERYRSFRAGDYGGATSTDLSFQSWGF